MFGFLGSFFRYFFGEAAPVQKDTFNYLAEGTKGGIKTVAAAVGEGLAVGMRGGEKARNRCSKCEHDNDADAKFCKNCGTPVTT
jgi:zinc-ribbon domain